MKMAQRFNAGIDCSVGHDDFGGSAGWQPAVARIGNPLF
jgi:hypothetical protein